MGQGPVEIAVARGDGIGPEISDAVLFVLKEAGAALTPRHITVGKAVYEQGITSGIPDGAWETIRGTKAFLKGPITTPQGGGYKSLNVTMRKTLSLFANVRPVRTYYPYVPTYHPDMDLVVVRENEEDTYGGIEHRQTFEVAQCLKLITRPGTERIVRYAFEYAKKHQRKKVTCLTKDNIMKITDGLFHQVFDEISKEYPEIETEHLIIDIGTARLATVPHRFDVVVTLNLYGDIISDVAAELSGSVGLAGSANIGAKHAMFEAIHGSAPDIAGKGIANPSGMLQGALLMLEHLCQFDTARTIELAWLKTIEDGIHTGDIASKDHTKAQVGTMDFAKAVVERLGQKPEKISVKEKAVTSACVDEEYIVLPQPKVRAEDRAQKPVMKGIDLFLHWHEEGRDPNALGKSLEMACDGTGFSLKMITNRGTKVYPGGAEETYRTDHWRCRFVSDSGSCDYPKALSLQQAITAAGHEIIKTENLYLHGDKAWYSMGQGE